MAVAYTLNLLMIWAAGGHRGCLWDRRLCSRPPGSAPLTLHAHSIMMLLFCVHFTIAFFFTLASNFYRKQRAKQKARGLHSLRLASSHKNSLEASNGSLETGGDAATPASEAVVDAPGAGIPLCEPGRVSFVCENGLPCYLSNRTI